jgi:hypothetical protein
MSSNYLDLIRGRRGRRQRSEFHFTAKTGLILIALIGMGASAIYWWGVQSQLTDNRMIAVAFTAILVLAPPSLTSFLLPWSPAGMLLQKVNARTWGYGAVIGCAVFLIYYSFRLQMSWWLAQPVVANSNLVYPQVLIGIIGFIIIPALLWTPVTPDELVEQVRLAHLVKRYELQTQADIAILRATLLRAQEKALIGFANLTVEEREELAGAMEGLITGIDRTLREVGESVKTVSGAMVPFEALEDNDDVQEILKYIGGSLTAGNMRTVEDAPRAGVGLRELGIEDRSVALAPLHVRASGQELSVPAARNGLIAAHDVATQPAGDRVALPPASAPAAAGELPPPRPAAPRRAPPRYAAEYESARGKLVGTWSAGQLADVLDKSERTARDRIAAWEGAGLVSRETDGKSSFYFTEHEVS